MRGHPTETGLMRRRLALAGGLIGLAAGLIFGLSDPAAATVTTTCTAYNSLNGTESFPGTYVGAVGSGPCQIGNIFPTFTASKATVNSAASPSNYEFDWGGGSLTIEEAIGPTTAGLLVDVELDSLAAMTSTSKEATLASIQLTGLSGLSTAEYNLITDEYVAPGYYTLSTYLDNGGGDPNYQANIDPVPEPSSLATLGAALLGLALVFCGRRRA